MVHGESPESPQARSRDELFRAAQRAYLRAEYFEAEAALHPIFASGTEDVEAALLLAGILRRTQRLDKAIQTLERLSKLEMAGFWFTEIRREQSICRKLGAQANA